MELKHGIPILLTASQWEDQKQNSGVLLSLILLAELSALFGDVLVQPHHGTVRKKCISYAQSLFVLRRELGRGASTEQCFCQGEL